MATTIQIPHYALPKEEHVTIVTDAVARSIAKPDAFMKPGSIGKPGGRGSPSTRIRMTNPNPKGRQRKRKHDPRAVKFY